MFVTAKKLKKVIMNDDNTKYSNCNNFITKNAFIIIKNASFKAYAQTISKCKLKKIAIFLLLVEILSLPCLDTSSQDLYCYFGTLAFTDFR